MRSARIFFQTNCEIVLEVDDIGTIIRCDNVLQAGAGVGYGYPGNVNIKNLQSSSVTVTFDVMTNDVRLSNYQAIPGGATRTFSNMALNSGCLYLRFTSNYTVTVTGGTLEKVIGPSSGIQGYNYFIKPDNLNEVSIEFGT